MRDGMVVVDADRHVIEPPDLWQRYMPAEVRDKAPGWDFSGPRGGNFQFAGVPVPEPEWVADRRGLFETDRFADAAARGYDVPSHLDAMDLEGIDLAVLFPSRGLLVPGVTGVAPGLIMQAAKAYNDWLADFCRDGQNRLFGVGMLDLRDTEGAVSEATRCVQELGFVGLFVRPNVVEGKPLFDSKYEPLWAAVAELDVPVCFHEGAKVRVPQVGPNELGQRWALWHVCTHPHAQQIAMVALVMGGVLERHPTLRCAFLECGAGWLPYWMWRMDEHAEPRLWRYQAVGEVADLGLTPSDYVRRQCYVSIESDEDPGRHAVEALAGTHIVWASDYPHIDSTFPGAVDAFMGLGGVTRQDKQRILCDNAVDMFGGRLGQAVDDRHGRAVSPPAALAGGPE